MSGAAGRLVRVLRHKLAPGWMDGGFYFTALELVQHHRARANMQRCEVFSVELDISI